MPRLCADGEPNYVRQVDALTVPAPAVVRRGSSQQWHIARWEIPPALSFTASTGTHHNRTDTGVDRPIAVALPNRFRGCRSCAFESAWLTEFEFLA
jgi:hypothetical protein